MIKFKKHLTKSNIITLLLLAFLAWRQIPLLIQNFKNEGVHLPAQTYQVLSSKTTLSELEFPPKDSKVITIFWATWCGPCKIDMQRLQTSVTDGKIKPDQIVAIAPFEDNKTVLKFLKENKYDFTFIEAPDISQTLKVEVTPTTIFFDKGVISSISTGLSFVGIWRAEMFLK